MCDLDKDGGGGKVNADGNLGMCDALEEGMLDIIAVGTRLGGGGIGAFVVGVADRNVDGISAGVPPREETDDKGGAIGCITCIAGIPDVEGRDGAGANGGWKDGKRETAGAADDGGVGCKKGWSKNDTSGTTFITDEGPSF